MYMKRRLGCVLECAHLTDAQGSLHSEPYCQRSSKFGNYHICGADAASWVSCMLQRADTRQTTTRLD